MREKLIIGNWKMHGDHVSIRDLLSALKVACRNASSSVKMIVCPPYVFLQQVQAVLQGSSIAWAAQNVAAEKNGAYTGEISASMLVEFACQYVLIGHSERRILYGETDAQIARKFKLAVEFGIAPVLCVGETQEQRQTGQTQCVLQRQIKAILDLSEVSLEHAIIAYEPVWAIGTGISATPEEAQNAHRFLREQIAYAHSDHLAQKLPILYGGSIKVNNANALFQMPDIDGGLVGGASLHADEFLKIYEACVSMVDA